MRRDRVLGTREGGRRKMGGRKVGKPVSTQAPEYGLMLWVVVPDEFTAP